MKNNFRAEDLKNAIKHIEKYMINNIFYYLKEGVLFKIYPHTYMETYSQVQILCDDGYSGDYFSNDFFSYYNTTIKNYILECKNKLVSENNINFFDKFSEYVYKINFLIYLDV